MELPQVYSPVWVDKIAPTMTPLEVETEQTTAAEAAVTAEGKRPLTYKLLWGVVLATIAAVAIWAGVQYGPPVSSSLQAAADISSSPTPMPTAVPSSTPTRMPTTVPSSAPTRVPTAVPSSAPIWVPTAVPSSASTVIPSRPSVAPTVTPIKLTVAPTRVPTAVPTLAPTLSSYLFLDTTQLANFDTAKSWNITKISHGRNSSLHQIAVDPATNSGNVLKVNYPAGSYRPTAAIVGGMGVYACPGAIFPARSVKLSYEVYFPADFNPVKGGKLPGLFIGPPGASGGNHVSNEASCRIMFRKNKSVGVFMTEAYVYIAQTQDPSYYTIPKLVLDPVDGDSLWRGLVNFNKGSWNKVDIFLTLNTLTSGVPNPDGFLNLTVNGVSESASKLIYTTATSLITGVIFTTFFGGADTTWATPSYQSSYFKNFILQKIA